MTQILGAKGQEFTLATPVAEIEAATNCNSLFTHAAPTHEKAVPVITVRGVKGEKEQTGRKDQIEYLTWSFKDVLITGYAVGGGAHAPQETIDLKFTRVAATYEGQIGPPQKGVSPKSLSPPQREQATSRAPAAVGPTVSGLPLGAATGTGFPLGPGTYHVVNGVIEVTTSTDTVTIGHMVDDYLDVHVDPDGTTHVGGKDGSVTIAPGQAWGISGEVTVRGAGVKGAGLDRTIGAQQYLGTAVEPAIESSYRLQALRMDGTPAAMGQTASLKWPALDANVVDVPHAPPGVVRGADAGQSPFVSLAHRDREPLSFLAYPANFRGGVSVAAGDVNGDGMPEIVTAPRTGAQPVKVFDLAGQEQQHFFPYGTTFGGGLRVAVGDFNGDGRAEIVTAAGPGSAEPVRVFDGKGTILSSFDPFGPGFAGGLRVAAGDINGDGIAEILTSSGPAAAAAPGMAGWAESQPWGYGTWGLDGTVILTNSRGQLLIAKDEMTINYTETGTRITSGGGSIEEPYGGTLQVSGAVTAWNTFDRLTGERPSTTGREIWRIPQSYQAVQAGQQVSEPPTVRPPAVVTGLGQAEFPTTGPTAAPGTAGWAESQPWSYGTWGLDGTVILTNSQGQLLIAKDEMTINYTETGIRITSGGGSIDEPYGGTLRVSGTVNAWNTFDRLMGERPSTTGREIWRVSRPGDAGTVRAAEAGGVVVLLKEPPDLDTGSLVQEGFLIVGGSPYTGLEQIERQLGSTREHQELLKKSHMTNSQFSNFVDQVTRWRLAAQALGTEFGLADYKKYFTQFVTAMGITATEQQEAESTEAVFAAAGDVIGKFLGTGGVDLQSLAASRTSFPVLNDQRQVVGVARFAPGSRAA